MLEHQLIYNSFKEVKFLNPSGNVVKLRHLDKFNVLK